MEMIACFLEPRKQLEETRRKGGGVEVGEVAGPRPVERHGLLLCMG